MACAKVTEASEEHAARGALGAQGLEVYVLRFRVQGLCFFFVSGFRD